MYLSRSRYVVLRYGHCIIVSSETQSSSKMPWTLLWRYSGTRDYCHKHRNFAQWDMDNVEAFEASKQRIAYLDKRSFATLWGNGDRTGYFSTWTPVDASIGKSIDWTLLHADAQAFPYPPVPPIALRWIKRDILSRLRTEPPRKATATKNTSGLLERGKERAMQVQIGLWSARRRSKP